MGQGQRVKAKVTGAIKWGHAKFHISLKNDIHTNYYIYLFLTASSLKCDTWHRAFFIKNDTRRTTII
jgi:hypothetical protein